MSYSVTIQLNVPSCNECHRPADEVHRSTIESPSMRLVSAALGRASGMHPLNYLPSDASELRRQLSTTRETMLMSPLIYMGMNEVVTDAGSYMLPRERFEITIETLDRLIAKLERYPQAKITYDVY